MEDGRVRHEYKEEEIEREIAEKCAYLFKQDTGKRYRKSYGKHKRKSAARLKVKR